MFVFHRSAFAVLAPLALLAAVVAFSSMSDEGVSRHGSPPLAQSGQQPENVRGSQPREELVARATLGGSGELAFEMP